MKIKKIYLSMLNLLYPNVCGICGKISAENLCPKCEIKLNKLAKIKVEYYSDKYFQKHCYLFSYEGIIKERLIAYKFHQKNYIADAIVNFMLKNKKMCSFLKNYDIIIPVPIHYQRKRKRGYNQSYLIAKELAKNIEKIECEEKVLIKTINNKPQSQKNKEERKSNVEGVYSVQNISKIENKKVLLLDDIYTTGSTLNECAKVLKQAGIRKIDVLTIAKD